MFHSSGPTRTLRAWACLAALALAAVPAHAVIIRGGRNRKDTARRQALARAAALEYPDVVRLETVTGKGTLEGTGVYLGLGADGSTGFVLTAAHCLLGDGSFGKIRQAILRFGAPDARWEHGLAVRAGKAFLLSTYQEDLAYIKGSTRALPCLDDLALVAFPAGDALRADLEDLRCAGMTPYEGKADGHLREGELVGYGKFGTHDGKLAGLQDGVYAGMTLVRYGNLGRFRGWLHVAPGFIKPAAGGADGFRHALHLRGWESQEPQGGPAVRIQSHPRQAFSAPGDSGGPLVFATPEGLRVAGVLALAIDATTPGPRSGQRQPCRIDFWTPVQDYLPWIRGVMAGEPGASRILDLDRIMEDKAGRADMAEGKEPASEHKETPTGEDGQMPALERVEAAAGTLPGRKRKAMADPGPALDPGSAAAGEAGDKAVPPPAKRARLQPPEPEPGPEADAAEAGTGAGSFPDPAGGGDGPEHGWAPAARPFQDGREEACFPALGHLDDLD